MEVEGQDDAIQKLHCISCHLASVHSDNRHYHDSTLYDNMKSLSDMKSIRGFDCSSLEFSMGQADVLNVAI